MEKKRRKTAELLAPAGSFESMKAAIAAGADAVYIGGSRFGARAYADNLDEEQMLCAIDYAHLRGVSLYLTVNTLVKEKELGRLYEYLLPYYERGLDAVIVQDLGVFAAVRTWFPDLSVHASTQMTITGVGGARLLKEMGASRVVTARELSLDELRAIHENVDIEIESFIHGALCYCYSGQCLLSSFIGGRSGNRGRCAQPCRLPYEVRREQKEPGEHCPAGRDGQYVMSLKDLCTLDILPDILESGVYSLKIEGRMKSPRYTAGVVSVYRKYLDLYQREGRAGYRVDEADRKILLDLFDRGGHTEGYYRKHNGRDMLTLREKPAFRQTNQALYDELDRAYVEAESKIKICGELKAVSGEPRRLKLWPEKAGESCENVQAGGEEERRTAFCKEADTDDSPSVELEGAVVQKAQNQPMTAQQLEKQMKKTGGTPFLLEDLRIHIEGDVFVPVQTLNELRRAGLMELSDAILKPYRRAARMRESAMAAERGDVPMLDASVQPAEDESDESGAAHQAGPFELHVLVNDRKQLETAIAEADVAEIQLEADAVRPEEWETAAERCRAAGKRCVLAMPVICRTEAAAFFREWKQELLRAGFDAFLLRSLEELDLLNEICGETGSLSCPPFYADHHLYAFNHLAAETLARMGFARLTFPLELNAREMGDLNGHAGWELTAYGYLPVMTTAQCIRRTVDRCTKQPGFLLLRDRTGKDLPVYNHCAYCYNTVYNPLPLSLLGMEETVLRLSPGSLRLQFLTETPEQMSSVIRAYGDSFLRRDGASAQGKTAAAGQKKTVASAQGKTVAPMQGKTAATAARETTSRPNVLTEFTRGHMKRGVE